MDITVQELQRRGFESLNHLVQGKITHAYQSPARDIILYWIDDDVCWYLQTFFDYPSVHPTPFTTFEELATFLHSSGR